MSDIREAFEALNKYRKAYDEMYQMLGIFLDADEGLEKPDIDEAWAAFNLAPGPVYWKAIEAALSANGGEALRDEDVESAFWEYDKMRADSSMADREAFKLAVHGMATHPAPPSVAVPDDVTATPSPDHSGDANKMVDVECCCGETEDAWRLCPSHGPNHIADAGKVVPIGYLTNQAVARLQSDKRLNGEHLYAFKPDDLSKFQAVYLAPTVKESLTVATPSVPEEEVKARALEDVAAEIERDCPVPCHDAGVGECLDMIRTAAARLRTAGDDGEGT